MFPSGPNGEKLPAYDVVVGCDLTGSIGQAENMARTVRDTMHPASKRQIEAWLAELSVLVVKRQDDEFSEALRVEAYAARLAQYPADVARSALLDHSWKFWPSWEELERVCESLASPRRAMLWALEHPKGEPTTPQERVTAEKAADILSRHGFTKKRSKAVAKSRMSRTIEEAEKTEDRLPHWTETAPPDDPRWKALKRARAENPLMNPKGAA